jgi:hypothetical protein
MPCGYKAAVESGGVESLFDKSRRQPNLKDRVDDLTEQSVLDYAVAYPAHGQVRVSNELRKAGVIVSPSGVPKGHKSAVFGCATIWRILKTD